MLYIPHDWHQRGLGRTNPLDPYAASPVHGLAHGFFIFLIRVFMADTLVERSDCPSDENAGTVKGQAPPNWPLPY